jgi:hypothetical protein
VRICGLYTGGRAEITGAATRPDAVALQSLSAWYQLGDPAGLANRYGAETTVLECKALLVCSGCGSRKVDMVVTGERRS